MCDDFSLLQQSNVMRGERRTSDTSEFTATRIVSCLTRCVGDPAPLPAPLLDAAAADDAMDVRNVAPRMLLPVCIDACRLKCTRSITPSLFSSDAA